MKKFWVIVITLIVVSFLTIIALFLINFFKPKPSGILVTSEPVSSVFIGGKLVGKTPYEGTFKAGEITIKIVPEEVDVYTSFEAKTTLVAGVKTVVRREFMEDGTSVGDIISFEKEESKSSSLTVITTPDNSQVSLDGTPKGFSPYRLNTVVPGEHQIRINAVGYKERVLTVNTVTGYRLVIVSNLAKEELPEEKKIDEETETKVFIEILTTPTGFLRVRTEPGSAGSEIHQVKPGEKYLFLEEDTETGWFKIQIQEAAPGLPNGITGWVSNEFAKKIEEETNLNSSN